MAIRMQQRRGTAQQWTDADPILAAGELGFETDSGKFKIGDGVNHWSDIVYFTADAAAALEDLIDGAPGLLNTLNELAAAVNDDPNFFSTVATNLSNHEADTTNVHGIANTQNLVTLAGSQTLTNKTLTSPVINTPTGIVKADVGLGNVDNTSDANKPVSTAQAAADSAVATAAAADATSKANAAQAAAIAAAATDATTKANAAKADAKTYTDTEISDLDSSVTSALNLKAPLASPTFTGTVSGITKSMVGLGNVDNTSDANKPVSTATQTELDLKAPLASPTFTGTVSGITKSMVGLGNVDNTSDMNKPVSTAQAAADTTVANAAATDATTKANAAQAAAIAAAAIDATTKANAAETNSNSYTDAEIEILDGALRSYTDQAELDAKAYTDAREIVIKSYAQTQAADYAANAAAGLVNSAPETLNTLNELAAALGNDANYATTITNSLGLKAPITSPTFNGTPTAPTASAGTNNTQIATTEFVATSLVAPLIDISNAQSDIADLQNDLNTVESDISSIQTNVGNISSDLGALTISANATQSDLDIAENEIISLDGRLDGAESNIVSLDSRLDSAESSITSINTTNTSQANSITFLTGKVSTYGTDILAIQADLGALDTRLDTAEPKITTLEADRTSLTTTQNSHGSRLNTAEANIISLDGRLDIAESTITSLDARLDTAETDITGLDTRLDTAESDINALELSMTSAQSDINTAESNISTLQSDLNLAESDIATLQGDLDTAESTLSTTVSSLSTHEAATLNVHGIANTANLATKSYADTAATNAQAAATNYVDAELVDYATLASPTFTGTVVLPSTTSIGTVSNTEIGYLDGVTSGVQSQINNKAPLASPVFTGTVSLPATTSIGTVDSTELSHLEGVTDNIQGQLSTKAPLSSPAFIGTPTAPTATAGTNTTQVATTAFVKTAVDNVIASAPGALDTLNELATALGNDANYAATVTSALALKAPLASPTFTGTVTLPSTTSIGTVSATELGYIDGVTSSIQTQIDTKSPSASPTFTGTVVLPSTTSIGDVSSTEIAFLDGVTSSVQTQINTKAPSASPTFTGTVALPATSSVTFGGTALSSTLSDKADKTASISSKTGAYTFASGDTNMIFEYNSASAGAFTIPADNSFWTVGQRLEVLQVGAGQLTISGAAGVTVNGTPTTKTRTTWSGATIIKRAANTFVVVGDLASS